MGVAKRIVGISGAALVGALVLVAVVLGRASSKELMVCAEGSGSHYLPAAWCHGYLTRFRMDAEGVAAFAGDGGFAFVLAIPSVELRQQLLMEWLTAGADANVLSAVDGLRPLHAAVLLADGASISTLVAHGADIRALDQQGRTALQLAQQLSSNGDERYAPIVAQLSAAAGQ